MYTPGGPPLGVGRLRGPIVAGGSDGAYRGGKPRWWRFSERKTTWWVCGRILVFASLSESGRGHCPHPPMACLEGNISPARQAPSAKWGPVRGD